MTKKSCPNCGAPYDVAENRCPYCGTYYFDMSCIDLSKQEPFYLKIKLPYMNDDIYLTQKVIPDLSGCSFELTADNDYVYAGGYKVTQYCSVASFNTNLAFRAIPDKQTVFEIKKE